MEIFILVLLYHLSQNPDFSKSVKPLMDELKNSEQMLAFLKDLSSFSDLFSTFKQEPCKEERKEEKKETEGADDKKNPQSPTKGIADEFIQNILNSYLKKI